jgi:hypothetical protein
MSGLQIREIKEWPFKIINFICSVFFPVAFSFLCPHFSSAQCSVSLVPTQLGLMACHDSTTHITHLLRVAQSQTSAGEVLV